MFGITCGNNNTQFNYLIDERSNDESSNDESSNDESSNGDEADVNKKKSRSIDVINENMIIINKLIIKPNFIFLCNAMITMSEIQWYCISVAKYQVWVAHFGGHNIFKIISSNILIFTVLWTPKKFCKYIQFLHQLL